MHSNLGQTKKEIIAFVLSWLENPTGKVVLNASQFEGVEEEGMLIQVTHERTITSGWEKQ